MLSEEKSGELEGYIVSRNSGDQRRKRKHSHVLALEVFHGPLL